MTVVSARLLGTAIRKNSPELHSPDETRSVEAREASSRKQTTLVLPSLCAAAKLLMASSKAAAAEARRQKLLARGTERLQGILGETPASNSSPKLAHDPNQGRLSVLALFYSA